MQVAPGDPPAAARDVHAGTPAVAMDRDFIVRNQIVERYLAGRLPARGALDFERYCQAHPELLADLHVAERVHAGVQLMEAGGLSLPWEVRQRRFWEAPAFVIGLAVLALAACGAAIAYRSLYVDDRNALGALRERLASQPLEPVQATRSVHLTLARDAPPAAPAVTLGAARAELADLKLQLGVAPFPAFRLTIDRAGQGRVLVASGLQRDSNGELRLALNTGLLGPGQYRVLVEGVNLRGEAAPQGWSSFAIAR